jgi:hypothetical protein
MSSTRSRNTKGDYRAEAHVFNNATDYLINKNYSYGQPISTFFPGEGLLQGRIASENLSSNNIDIETQLFGIGSTNLENPKTDESPQIKQLKSLSIINRLPIVIPEPLFLEKGQRPYPLP